MWHSIKLRYGSLSIFISNVKIYEWINLFHKSLIFIGPNCRCVVMLRPGRQGAPEAQLSASAAVGDVRKTAIFIKSESRGVFRYLYIIVNHLTRPFRETPITEYLESSVLLKVQKVVDLRDGVAGQRLLAARPPSLGRPWTSPSPPGSVSD